MATPPAWCSTVPRATAVLPLVSLSPVASKYYKEYMIAFKTPETSSTRRMSARTTMGLQAVALYCHIVNLVLM